MRHGSLPAFTLCCAALGLMRFGIACSQVFSVARTGCIRVTDWHRSKSRSPPLPDEAGTIESARGAIRLNDADTRRRGRLQYGGGETYPGG